MIPGQGGEQLWLLSSPFFPKYVQRIYVFDHGIAIGGGYSPLLFEQLSR